MASTWVHDHQNDNYIQTEISHLNRDLFKTTPYSMIHTAKPMNILLFVWNSTKFTFESVKSIQMALSDGKFENRYPVKLSSHWPFYSLTIWSTTVASISEWMSRFQCLDRRCCQRMFVFNFQISDDMCFVQLHKITQFAHK